MSSPTHVLSRAPRATAGTPMRGLIRRALDRVAEWRARARERRDLPAMSDHALRDMGLDRASVWAECDKPFWRP